MAELWNSYWQLITNSAPKPVVSCLLLLKQGTGVVHTENKQVKGQHLLSVCNFFWGAQLCHCWCHIHLPTKVGDTTGQCIFPGQRQGCLHVGFGYVLLPGTCSTQETGEKSRYHFPPQNAVTCSGSEHLSSYRAPSGSPTFGSLIGTLVSSSVPQKIYYIFCDLIRHSSCSGCIAMPAQ